MEEHKHEHEHPAPRHEGLSAFSPKQTFAFGLVGGLLVLCSIGFFVLLGVIFLGDSGFNVKSGAKVADEAAAANPGAQNPAVADPREVDEDTDHILGAKNAKVTIIEYSDFQCPFCARFHPTMQKIIENYGKDVRWVYRHFPLESIHQNARPLALASECAAEQGKFWEFADAMIPDNGAGSLENYASKSGVNYAKMKSCIDSGKYNAKVDNDAKDAVATGGQGTPYSLIIGPDGKATPLSGAQPYEAVEAAVKSLL